MILILLIFQLTQSISLLNSASLLTQFHANYQVNLQLVPIYINSFFTLILYFFSKKANI